MEKEGAKGMEWIVTPKKVDGLDTELCILDFCNCKMGSSANKGSKGALIVIKRD